MKKNVERISVTIITICHYHRHDHHKLSLSSSQPPPSVTIIITITTTIVTVFTVFSIFLFFFQKFGEVGTWNVMTFICVQQSTSICSKQQGGKIPTEANKIHRKWSSVHQFDIRRLVLEQNSWKMHIYKQVCRTIQRRTYAH